MLNSKTDTGVNQQLLARGTPVAPQSWIAFNSVFAPSTSKYVTMHACAGTSAIEWNTEMLPSVLWGFQNFSVFSRLCSPLFSFSLSSSVGAPKTISSAKPTFGTPLLGFSYLSDLNFCSTVSIGFFVGHLESQRRNYFSAFCWDGGMSLLWNAAWLANGVTQDGWSEATGMRRIDEEEKW